MLSKPHADFPLTPNNSIGYWVKKIRRKVHRFGPRWCEPEVALEEFLAVKDYLLLGRDPPNDQDALTIQQLVNHFLTDRTVRKESGELTQRSWDDYYGTCEGIVKHFGKKTAVTSLTPRDFTAYRKNFGGSPTVQGNHIGRIRTVFNFAYKADLVVSPVKFGETFKKPSKATMRKFRASKPKKLFTAEQVRDFVANANNQIKAMVLLGVNCGFGNSDCARLTPSHITGEWHDYARPKTGILRRCWLWPETREAIKSCRTSGDLVFRTCFGNQWTAGGVSSEFRKLGPPKGLSFGCLRHTCETIGGQAKDQVALDHIMGHVRDDMATVYREEIDDDRLKAVSEAIRVWFR